VGDVTLDHARAQRYAGWDGLLGQSILTCGADLAVVAAHVQGAGPQPVSGGQEALENLANRFV